MRIAPGPKKWKKGSIKGIPQFWAHLGSVAHFWVFSFILSPVDGVRCHLVLIVRPGITLSLTSFKLSPLALPWRRHRKRKSKLLILFLWGVTEEELVIRCVGPPWAFDFFRGILSGWHPAAILLYLDLYPWMSDRQRVEEWTPCILFVKWRWIFIRVILV
jgi:hypothetical protein